MKNKVFYLTGYITTGDFSFNHSFKVKLEHRGCVNLFTIYGGDCSFTVSLDRLQEKLKGLK